MKLTPAHAEFLQSVAGGGGLAFMARSMEEVRERLAEEGVVPPQRRLFQVEKRYMPEPIFGVGEK